jgi:hypothetical protein
MAGHTDPFVTPASGSDTCATVAAKDIGVDVPALPSAPDEQTKR